MYIKNNAQIKYNTLDTATRNLAFQDTTKLSKHLKNLISNIDYFFLATSSKNGKPNVNFKGGEAGFIHIIDDNTLLFPDFEGNGILHGINDIMENPNIAMLFIDFLSGYRYKVNGTATIIDDKNELSKYLNIKGFDYPSRIIKVEVSYAIGNCSKNINLIRDKILELEQNWETPCGG